MGKTKEFKINFDNGKEIYFAGEMLSGNVVLSLSEPLQMLRIILFVEGKAICTTSSHCTETVYKNSVTLFGSLPEITGVSGIFNQEHPIGRQSYRFNFLLPQELPSSIKAAKNGMIKYYLTAKIEFKGLKGFFSSNDWKVKKTIQIKEIIDANLPNYELQDVQTVKKIPTLFSNAIKLEKNDLLVAIQRAVCCPGEEIMVNIQYKYVIAKKMGLIKTRLNKYSQFNKKENRGVQKKMITELNDGKRINDRIYQRILKIKIPDNISATNTLTNAVVINYVVHVKIEGYKEAKLPIIIGTIPYDETHANMLSKESTNDSTISGPSQASLLPSAPPSAPRAAAPAQEARASYDPPPYQFSVEEEEEDDDISNTDIPCEFFHPPPYIPDDEFDLPPSYEESTESSSHSRQLVEAH